MVCMRSGTSVWCILRSQLVKASMENVALATSDERQGIEQVEQWLPELKEELLRRRRRREYWDLTGDAVVPEEEFPRAQVRRQTTESTRIPDDSSESAVPSGQETPRGSAPIRERSPNADEEPAAQRQRLAASNVVFARAFSENHPVWWYQPNAVDAVDATAIDSVEVHLG